MRSPSTRGRVGRCSVAVRFVVLIGLIALVGCPSPGPSWQIVERDLPSALLSVWGSSENDVFVVGGDRNDGQGPAVMHFDGAAWTRLSTGHAGNLWWVTGFAGGPVYMGGDGGMILRYDAGVFTRMPTPGTDTVFGLWGASPDDMWAVGGAVGGANGAFAWRLVGDTWIEASGFPTGISATNAIWKMHGRSADDAWMIGTNGQAVRWDGTNLTALNTGAGESLFTVHADADRFVAVGGFGTGMILENDGAGWQNASPSGAFGLIGVALSGDGGGYAVGQEGAVYARGSSGWSAVELGFTIEESLHSVWIDPTGGVWAVGGQVQTFPLVRGILIHEGTHVPGGLR